MVVEADVLAEIMTGLAKVVEEALAKMEITSEIYVVV